MRRGSKRLDPDPDELIESLRGEIAGLEKSRNVKQKRTRIEALVDLGNAYMARRTGTRADNVEAAIRCYKQALEYLYGLPGRGEDDADEHDRVRALLAITYDERVLGSREENISQILVHTDSLDLNDESDAELYAVTRILRAKAFRDRDSAQGLGLMDQHIALSFLEDALKRLRKRDSPEYWAQAHLETGRTLLNVPTGDPRVNWRDAKEHFEKALGVYDADTQAAKFATVQELLGQYHLRWSREVGGAEARARALGHYSLALQHLSAAENPAEWARVHVSLAHMALGGARGGALAISHYESALGALSRPEHSAARLSVLEEFGDLELRARRWTKALPRFKEALELALALVNDAHSLAGRRTATSGISGLAACLAYCHFQLSQLDEALITLESGKIRLLTEALQWTDDDEAELTEEERRQLADLNEKIRHLESTQYGGISAIETSDRLEVLRAQLTSRRKEIQQRRPQALRHALTVSKMAPTEPGTAIVVPLVTPVGSALFILTHADQTVATNNVIPLPDFTTDDIGRWLTDDEPGVAWLSAYQHRNDGAAEQQRWRAVMLDVGARLWDGMIVKLSDRLHELGVQRIVVVPSAGLQFLPIHAAAPRDQASRYFVDEVTVSYAPSAYVLAVSTQRSRNCTTTGTPLVAGVSEYESLPALANVKTELEMVGSVLGSSVFVNEAATRTRVLHDMAVAPIVHIACHGEAWALRGALFRMAWSPPAVLHLWRDGLSFQDLLRQDLRKVRLVCLSACDTGMVDASLPWDEFEGLANVFLQAGAAAIVSSLWAVDDQSTALLMQRFYENLHHRGQNPADALREAQIWLRDGTRGEFGAVYERLMADAPGRFMQAYTDLILAGGTDDRPYAHPSYWAAFALTGV
jgi:CHAT domain-containing protein